MKFVLLIAIAIACIGVQVWASDEEEAALMHAASEKCKEKEGVSEDELEQFNDGKFDDGNGQKNVMCYVKCILDEFDGLDGDVLKEDVFLGYFEPHLGEPKAKEYYDSCKGETGDGECETPFKIIACLRRIDDIFKF